MELMRVLFRSGVLWWNVARNGCAKAGRVAITWLINAPNRVLMRHVMATLPDVRYRDAATGADGVALACRERPDIIITDINMPGMDGYAVLQYLQAAPETARIPVLALTSDEIGRAHV